ncbi:MAG: sulfotransferase [Gammaproteobacteria bacterium]|nr:sulfotransferase [Gammaproteobacteria bacterium]
MTQTRFMVLGSQRTGSTLIRTSLDSHPSIRCYGEIFLMPGIGPDSYPYYVSQSRDRKVKDLVFRRRLVRKFLHELYNNDIFDAVGFKFMYSQAKRFPYRRAPTVVDYAREHGVRIIHVIRENALKTLISRINARNTGIYHVKGESQKGARITIPTKTLLNELTRIKSEDNHWATVFAENPYLLVHYEDFVESPEMISGKMLRFLGFDDDIELTSPHKKVITSGLDEVIENYNDVRRALIGSEFSGFLP